MKATNLSVFDVLLSAGSSLDDNNEDELIPAEAISGSISMGNMNCAALRINSSLQPSSISNNCANIETKLRKVEILFYCLVEYLILIFEYLYGNQLLANLISHRE